MVMYPADVSMFSSGMIMYPAGVSMFSSGMIMYPAGVSMFSSGMIMYPAGVSMFSSGMIMHAAGVSISSVSTPDAGLMRYVHAEYGHAAHLLQTRILHDFTMIRYDYGQKVRYGIRLLGLLNAPI